MPDYTAEWTTGQGNLYARMMVLMDSATGMFDINEIHVTHDHWKVRVHCAMSIEHVRTYLINVLHDDFVNIEKYIHIIQMQEE